MYALVQRTQKVAGGVLLLLWDVIFIMFNDFIADVWSVKGSYNKC